jgi:hypothetical protein
MADVALISLLFDVGALVGVARHHHGFEPKERLQEHIGVWPFPGEHRFGEA